MGLNMQVGVDRGIGWTDATWNPVSGCHHGCTYCYARSITRRFPGTYPSGFEPTFHPKRMVGPRSRKKPTMIFTVDMGDLFGDWVPDRWIEAVLSEVRACPQHTFQFLTKAPQNLARWNPWPENAWVGGTVDTRERLDHAIAALHQVDAPIRFLSFEPLLEDMGTPDLDGIQWVIMGALTGSHRVQPGNAWVYSLFAAASKAWAPIFMKRNLGWVDRIQTFPPDHADRCWRYELLSRRRNRR